MAVHCIGKELNFPVFICFFHTVKLTNIWLKYFSFGFDLVVEALNRDRVEAMQVATIALVHPPRPRSFARGGPRPGLARGGGSVLRQVVLAEQHSGHGHRGVVYYRCDNELIQQENDIGVF